MVYIFAQMVYNFAQNTTLNPFTQQSHTPYGDMYTKNLQATPKHPFSWPEFENGQNKLTFGQFGPQLGKIFQKWTKKF